jgi:hypothetical protein
MGGLHGWRERRALRDVRRCLASFNVPELTDDQIRRGVAKFGTPVPLTSLSSEEAAWRLLGVFGTGA